MQVLAIVVTASPDGTTIEHHDKVDIEQALCKENKRKHQLVHQTPIANSPSKEDFGLDGLTQETVKVAEGTHTAPAKADKGIQEWLQLMKKINKQNQMQTQCNVWNHMNLEQDRKKQRKKQGAMHVDQGTVNVKLWQKMML